MNRILVTIAFATTLLVMACRPEKKDDYSNALAQVHETYFVHANEFPTSIRATASYTTSDGKETRPYTPKGGVSFMTTRMDTVLLENGDPGYAIVMDGYDYPKTIPFVYIEGEEQSSNTNFSMFPLFDMETKDGLGKEITMPLIVGQPWVVRNPINILRANEALLAVIQDSNQKVVTLQLTGPREEVTYTFDSKAAGELAKGKATVYFIKKQSSEQKTVKGTVHAVIEYQTKNYTVEVY